MLIKNLKRDHLEPLKKAFEEELRADLIDCWGDCELDIMVSVFNDNWTNRTKYKKTGALLLDIKGGD